MRRWLENLLRERKDVCLLTAAFVIIVTVFLTLSGEDSSQKKQETERSSEYKIRVVKKEKTEPTVLKKEYVYRTHRFPDHRKIHHKLRYRLLKSHIQETLKTYGYSEEKLKRVRVKKKYLSEHMMTIKNNRIAIDYKRIQMWQVPFVEGVYNKLKVNAISNTMNEKEFIILISNFVQYLNYKKIPKDVDKNILGYWAPVICLNEKGGDCDSKSILFSTIFYHYQHNSCVLFISDPPKPHAFIGIKNQHKIFPTDKIFNIKGIDYLILESTSPHFPLGNVPAKYKKHLINETYRIIHLY